MNSKDLSQLIAKYRKDRPKPERKWDQFLATDETTVKRALYLEDNGETKSRVVLLGDDDLTSIALAKLGANVTVLEIDERLTNLIKRVAQKEGLTIQILEHDLQNELPRSLLGKFDAVFTDPPYTPGGISLFLNNSIKLLKNVTASQIYMCYGTGEKAQERDFKIQEIIMQKGLLIEEKIKDFNQYAGAATIGNKSSLFKLSFTPSTRTSPYPGARIYTNQ